MGLFDFGSANTAGGSGKPGCSAGTAPKPPMPDPEKFRILKLEGVNDWSIAEVHYPACTTYGGRKLLVYAAPPGVVKRQAILDPHFLERDDRLSPVARFEPTTRGRALAKLLCQYRRGA